MIYLILSLIIGYFLVGIVVMSVGAAIFTKSRHHHKVSLGWIWLIPTWLFALVGLGFFYVLKFVVLGIGKMSLGIIRKINPRIGGWDEF